MIPPSFPFLPSPLFGIPPPLSLCTTQIAQHPTPSEPRLPLPHPHHTLGFEFKCYPSLPPTHFPIQDLHHTLTLVNKHASSFLLVPRSGIPSSSDSGTMRYWLSTHPPFQSFLGTIPASPAFAPPSWSSKLELVHLLSPSELNAIVILSHYSILL